MADAKYGRLFTEEDVSQLVAVAYASGFTDAEQDFRRLDPRRDAAHNRAELLRLALESGDRLGLTFPADEPLFLLRGQDVAAPDAIADGPLCYEDECQQRGASDEHRRAVVAAADAMRAWQAMNPDRVKVPD